MSDTPIKFPSRVRASEVREHLSGCMLRTMLGYMYPAEAVDAMWFHQGTGVHLGIEYLIESWHIDMSLTERVARASEVAGGYILANSGPETVYAVHTPDLSEALRSTEAMLATFVRQWPKVRPKWAARIETEVRAELPGFGTDIDCVVTHEDGGFTVIDWKTGGRATADPIQLRIYAWALRQLGYGECRGAFFWHVRQDKVQPVDIPNTREEDAYIEHLIDATLMVKAEETLALSPRPGWQCDKFCSFQDRCPAFGGDLTELAEHYRMGVWTDRKVQY